MSKTLKCGAVIPGCEFVAHGETEGDILMKEAEHVRAAHGVGRISEDLKTKIKAAIKDE